MIKHTMKSVLITGCNRGIGLELVKQLSEHTNAPEKILASCRNPSEAKDLQKLSEVNKTIHILKLDVTDLDSFESFAQTVENIVGEGGLNVLINNAGMSDGGKTKGFLDIKADLYADMYKTNTIAPIFMIKALHPLLKKAADNCQSFGVTRATVLNTSSIFGSVSENTFGGSYGYRESKAALNTATRSISYELVKEGILVVAIHPGWVKTDMGGENAQITTEFSVRNIIDTMLSLNEQHSGAFLQYDGKILPW